MESAYSNSGLVQIKACILLSAWHTLLSLPGGGGDSWKIYFMELLYLQYAQIHSIFNSQLRVLNVSSINSVRHRMAWKIAATSSDKESDNSLLGTSSLVCWPVEAFDGVILCEPLLILLGDDGGADAIITTEC
jgi:hypothetical protein